MKRLSLTVRVLSAVISIVGITAAAGDWIDRKRNGEDKIHTFNGPYEKYMKRPLDAVLAAAALILLFPVIIIIGFLVRINLGTPVLFSQDRPGLNEKIFKLYKFRTMTDERGEDGKLLPDGIRLTKFGRILRSTSLDELPELFNIIKGDMAIIGPRPLLVKYLERYTEEQHKRHDVRPGLTGLAMSRVRNGAGWDKKFELDLEYVDNISFLLDLKIIIWTIAIVLKREGINEYGQATNSEFMGTMEEK